MEQNPLFQLNLMIYLAWRSAPAFVSPIFRNAGYVLDRIGQNIPTDLQVLARLQSADPPIPIKSSSSPDVLLRHEKYKQFVPIECKVNSFGPDRDEARQATAMLSFEGAHLAQFLGVDTSDSWDVYLCYAVTSTKESPMFDTLSMLSTRLIGMRVPTAAVGAFGIDVRDDGIYLTPEKRSTFCIQSLRTAPDNGLQVMRLKRNQDPRPLYIVPLDPDWNAEDDYGKRALEERVRASLASMIGSRLNESEFEIQTEELLRQSIEVWDIWRADNARERIKYNVKKYTREILRQIEGLDVRIEVGGGRALFQNITPDKASKIRHYLASANFRKGKIDLWGTAIQLELNGMEDL